jgi:hypothetical protein
MNELLAARYRALFLAHDAGGASFLAGLRGRIAERTVPAGPLRPDAALFLLLMYDRMLLRPYLGAIAEPGSTRLLPQAASEPGVFLERVSGSLDLVIGLAEDMRDGRGEVSAHAVMQAIDRLWPELAERFDWS